MSDNRTDCEVGKCAHLTEVLAKLEFLTNEVGDLKKQVSDLSNWIHTAKGAAMVITAILGAILTSIVGYLIGRR